MESCRACDGNGRVVARTIEGVKVNPSNCNRCSGSGVEPGPSKGGKRRFGSHIKQNDEELSLEAQTRAFLRSKGF